MSVYNIIEREQIVSIAMGKIDKYINNSGMFLPIEKDDLSFMEYFKKQCQLYIYDDNININEYGGVLQFSEINKKIHYILPIYNKFPLLFRII